MSHFKVAKEEIAFYGVENSSLQNILAVLIGPKADAAVTGRLASLGVRNLMEMGIEELKKYEGIGEMSARRIVSSLGLATHLRRISNDAKVTIRSPEDASRVFEDLSSLNHEVFEVLFLNTKNHVLARKMIFKGSLAASIVHPREVFKEALKLSSASIIAAHNHPSGDPTPSREDIEVTKRLVEVGKVIGIELLDHIIIGQGRFTSLKEKGHI